MTHWIAVHSADLAIHHLIMKILSALAATSNAVAESPTIVLAPSVVGLSALSAYYNIVISDIIAWFIPSLAVILCDLFTGVRAAIARKERVTFSNCARRTLSKIVAYLCWTIFAVCVGHNTDWDALTWGTMLIILFIEGSSCVSNVIKRENHNPLESFTSRQIAAILINKIFRTDIKADDLKTRGCQSQEPEMDVKQTTTPKYGNDQENSEADCGSGQESNSADNSNPA